MSKPKFVSEFSSEATGRDASTEEPLTQNGTGERPTRPRLIPPTISVSRPRRFFPPEPSADHSRTDRRPAVNSLRHNEWCAGRPTPTTTREPGSAEPSTVLPCPSIYRVS